MNTTIILDLETTALLLPGVAQLDKQPRIIEIGAIAIDEQYNVLRSMSHLINPEIPIREETTKITGLTTELLKAAPTFKQVVPDLQNFFLGADLLIAHNAPFDIQVLNYELERIRPSFFQFPRMILCSAQEYRHRIGFNPHLTDLYERIMGVPLNQTHRGLDDCKALLDILKKDEFLARIFDVV